MRAGIALLLWALAGCGVAGPPVPLDAPERTGTGISMSGSAETGVAGDV